MSDAPSPKTSRGQRSRARIISTTRQLLADADLSSLKLDAVAEKSGVAKSSVLWHFGSKNGLLLAVVEDIFEGMQQLIQEMELSDLDKRGRLKKMMLALADEMQRTPEANTLLISFIVNQTLDQTIIAQIKSMYGSYRQFIRRMLESSGVPVDDHLPAVILALIDGAFLQWYLQPDQISLRDLFARSIDLMTLDQAGRN